ncbi:hypothetical protein TRFO_23480 [Tritrichomonas foetus]|uniref:Uncharacterized protein n=1 Tax=Tritrichomonas foetus TaxID=1144522 RepID=A0A1J4KEG6_9EUKA|nr:hypothetical protein TRFO_23480 [Tritrichomonas foetus]|eukprot:OHT08116.1 hypothetical protein TRFO_23480 [Tritrichomonas foetus]
MMKNSKKKIMACSYSETQQKMYEEIEDTFCVAFTRGFALANSYSGDIISCTTLPYKGTSFVSTINNSNILAIIPNEKDFVHIWDLKKKCLLFGISLKELEDVTGLLLRPDCVIVVAKTSVNVFNLYDQKKLGSVKTASNPNGAFDIPPSFSSTICAVLGQNTGEFKLHSYIDPNLEFPTIKAFSKEINVLRFSPNGQVLGVSSLASKKIKLYHVPEIFEIGSLKLPISEDGAVDIRFDLFDSYMFVITPSKTMYLYTLDCVDFAVKPENPITLKYSASFSLPDHGRFFAYFTSKLNLIDVISEKGVHYVLRYKKSTKKFLCVQETVMNLPV